MQLATITPQVVRQDPPASPLTRTEAAQALLAVPMGAMMVASMTAMGKAMSQTPASRAELRAQFVAKLPVENVYMTIANAIDGAIAVAPELAPRNDALRAAAKGVAELLAQASTDTASADAMTSLKAISEPLQAVAMPLFEAAVLLDPNVAKPKG
jgi:hypothetical protein